MKRIVLLLLPAVTLLFSLATAEPGPHHPCRGHGGKGPDSACAAGRKHRMFDDLKLTEEQQTKLKTLHDEMITVRKKHMEAVKSVRDKMRVELLKKSPARKTLDGFAGELGNLHKKMTKDRTAHLLKVKKVLTPEQFTRLVEKEERMECGHGRAMRPGKCPGMGDCQRRSDCPHKGDCPYAKKGGAKDCCPHMRGAKPATADSTAAKPQ